MSLARDHLLTARQLVVWVLVIAGGGLASVPAFERAFPQAPELDLDRWSASLIAEERWRDLGGANENPYVSAMLLTSPPLELRLAATPALGVDESELRGRQAGWLVTQYDSGTSSQSWSRSALLALDGEVLQLLRAPRRGADDPSAAVQLDAFDAEARAADFLTQQGFDLGSYGSPSVRRTELADNTRVVVRFESLERLLGERLRYGVEVHFYGDDVMGFSSWVDDPQIGSQLARLRPTSLLKAVQALVVFLVLPFVAVAFVRSYHRGTVGVARAVHVFFLVLLSGAAAYLLGARAAAEGSVIGNLTRAQTTWLFVVLALVVVLPALAAVSAMASALGEAGAQGVWRTRLAAFDALFRAQWTNSVVAAASLRGVGVGVILALGALLVIPELRTAGIVVPWSFLLGPLWQNAVAPGVALLLVKLVFVVAAASVLLMVVPRLCDRFGNGLGLALSALPAAVLIPQPFASAPIHGAVAMWLAATSLWLFLFWRFGLATAAIAHLVSTVLLAALPLMTAGSVALQINGWLAVVGACAPLIVSARYLSELRPYHYYYDDVPPHVRRIAERERQRVELETAREIQSSILPSLPTSVGDVEIAHTYLPATEVGGDFYDVLELDDGSLAISIGDVAGHGVSSGLIMSMVRSALTVQVGFRPAVADVIAALNRVVHLSSRKRLLVTMCYGVLSPDGEFSFACAGHLHPYRLTPDGKIEELESTSYPLGVRERLDVDQRRAHIDVGELLFFASDGLVEARRLGSEELFGFERLERSLVRHCERESRGLLDGVLLDLESFVHAGAGGPLDSALDDDLTVLVLRRRQEPSAS